MKTTLRCPDCGHSAYRHAPADKERHAPLPHPKAGCSVPECTCSRTVVS